MDCRVAYLAEQNCRKSAEARLDTELRKMYKLQAHNQEIAHHNAKLQQQLRASKNEVPSLMAMALSANTRRSDAIRLVCAYTDEPIPFAHTPDLRMASLVMQVEKLTLENSCLQSTFKVRAAA